MTRNIFGLGFGATYIIGSAGMFNCSYLPVILTLFKTHWGRVTHICVSKLTIIGWDNGLSPGWHQAIIWTNTEILLIRTLETNFSEILSEIRASSFRKMYLKMSSAKWRPFCLGLNVLIHWHCGHNQPIISPQRRRSTNIHTESSL